MDHLDYDALSLFKNHVEEFAHLVETNKNAYDVFRVLISKDKITTPWARWVQSKEYVTQFEAVRWRTIKTDNLSSSVINIYAKSLDVCIKKWRKSKKYKNIPVDPIDELGILQLYSAPSAMHHIMDCHFSAYHITWRTDWDLHYVSPGDTLISWDHVQLFENHHWNKIAKWVHSDDCHHSAIYLWEWVFFSGNKQSYEWKPYTHFSYQSRNDLLQSWDCEHLYKIDRYRTPRQFTWWLRKDDILSLIKFFLALMLHQCQQSHN